MNYLKILFPALISACLVLFFHITALKYHLYFEYWWFDMVIHFLAGLTISLTLVYLVWSFFPSKISTILSSATVALPVVLVFAVGWEVFELYSKLIYAKGFYYIVDTAIDIGMGLLGCMMGVIYISTFLTPTWRKQP